MITPSLFLSENTKEEDYDKVDECVNSKILLSNVFEYMVQYAELCIKEDRIKVAAYLTCYPKGDVKNAPRTKFDEDESKYYP